MSYKIFNKGQNYFLQKKVVFTLSSIRKAVD